MNCDSAVPQRHIELLPGDQNSASHLQLARKVPAGSAIHLDICTADVVLLASKSDQIEVTLDLANPPATATAADYVQNLSVSASETRLHLHLSKQVKGRVVIAVPAATPRLEVNLVHGDLSFQTDRIRGDRSINLVHGHLDVESNADAYATMHVDTVMASFHDRRSGQESHGMTSREITGTGQGTIEINVVMGGVELKAWD
ncbi:MAG TPA: hypothetical protein VF753_09200 [Terriglobales bacterium]